MLDHFPIPEQLRTPRTGPASLKLAASAETALASVRLVQCPSATATLSHRAAVDCCCRLSGCLMA